MADELAREAPPRVHITLDIAAGMTETLTFPLADAVGALAALGSVHVAANVEPAASDAGSAAAVSFRAEGRGKSFEIEALFCTPHASSEAFEKWVGDVLVAAAPSSQWFFARFAKPSRITCLSLLAWMETGYNNLEANELDSDAIIAMMSETEMPSELCNVGLVTARAISKHERKRRVAAIAALETESDACITRYFGHFRRPTRAVRYYADDEDGEFASTAFELRIAFQTVPTDDDVRQAVLLTARRLFITVARTRTCSFVWSTLETSKRIVQVLARIDSRKAPKEYKNPVQVFEVEALHKASTLPTNDEAFCEAWDEDEAFMTVEEKGVIAVGLNPLSSARLVPLWARAIAHQSPEEQVAAFVNGWIQLP